MVTDPRSRVWTVPAPRNSQTPPMNHRLPECTTMYWLCGMVKLNRQEVMACWELFQGITPASLQQSNDGLPHRRSGVLQAV